jgi:hypothetical protein
MLYYIVLAFVALSPLALWGILYKTVKKRDVELENFDILVVPTFMLMSISMYIAGFTSYLFYFDMDKVAALSASSMFCMLYPYWKGMKYYSVTGTFLHMQLKVRNLIAAVLWASVVLVCMYYPA